MMADLTGEWISENKILFRLHMDDKKISFVLTDDNLTSLEEGKSFEMTEGLSQPAGERYINVDGNRVIFPIVHNDMLVSLDRNHIFDVAESAPVKARNPGKGFVSGNADDKYNPDDPQWKEAVKQAENFNMKEAENFRTKTLNLPTKGEPVPQIGKVAAIIYTSDKEKMGPSQQYIHEFHEPLPNLLLYGPNGSPVYIIEGGKTKISEAGDDSGEAPGWMIQ